MPRYRPTNHAIRQARKRIDKSFGVKELAHTGDQSILLFTSNKGEQYRLLSGTRAVCVTKGRTILTVVTLGMAFSDCPYGTFLALLENDRLVDALALRAKGEMRELPRAIEKKYKYHRRKAAILWNVFRWADSPLRSTLR
ncbi:MAG: hypothetical protein GF334_13395 [Candidatus Altiarchaeales archaeon]|nr:hypothetical protein [Candidatus Altiarchaeales archaeon]